MTGQSVTRAAPRRYWDLRHHAWTTTVLAGEWYVTEHDLHLSAVLGSCVAVCARDRVRLLGGMNHILTPNASGAALVDALLDRLLALGARASDLELKVFGGGRVLSDVADIGARNIDHVLTHLDRRGLAVAAADIGGDTARRIRYQPSSGRSLVQHLPIGGSKEAP